MYAQQPAITSIFERSFAHDQLKVSPYKLGEVNSGRMYPVSAPGQRGEGRGWNVPRSEPSLLDHKRGPYNVPLPAQPQEDIETRPEISPRIKSTEQLPPLSSLFSSPRPPITSRSSYSNPSPTFEPASPRSSHRSAGQNHQDQPRWDGRPYPSRPQSEPSNQYAYNRAVIPLISSGLPAPPPRAIVEHRQPNSPGYFDPRSEIHDVHRQRSSASSSRWSPRPEPPYRDYLPPMPKVSTSPYGHPRDQKSLQSLIQRHESETRRHYPEASQANSGRNQYHPSVSNTVASDPAPSTDTLGPKIWTGTHFLPRFVRQAEVPGEGICYFYDDGTHCKTVIDGEPVNAHWGVTKAGKPRKRLAIACITCREKKIKCDPDYPRCVQCEKFGRVCKFKNAPRGGHGSPETPSADSDDIVTRPVSQLSELEGNKLDRRDVQYSTFHQGKQSPRPEGDENAPKRRRSTYDAYTPLKSEQRQEGYYFGQIRSSTRQQLSPRLSHQSLDWYARQAATNPFDTNEALSLDLLDTYFAHIGSTTYCFLPEQRFRRWVTDRSIRKSTDDLLLIYSVLAMATTYSTRDDIKDRGEEFAAICRYAANGREFTLQLVQSRLLLSMYYFAIDVSHDAWDYCGGALRAATGLNLNLEIDESEKDSGASIFNLNRYGYAECRRRTFWSCYLMDHFSGFCNGHLSTINPKDIFLRYPCEMTHFEDQADVVAPFFDSSRIPISGTLENAGGMAYLINIISIWGDVRANIYRGSQSSPAVSSEPFSSFYTNTNMRLKAWCASLPQCLQFSAETLDKHGISSSFVTMHVIYHVTHAKLNRCVKRDSVPSYQLQSSIRLAYQHSNMILQVADVLANRATRLPNTPTAASKFSSPYCGFAIVVAIDIVTAKGRLRDIAALKCRIESARRIVDELAAYWRSGRAQQEKIATRLDALAALPVHANGWNAANSSGAGALAASDVSVDVEMGTFEMQVPLDTAPKAAGDCVYGAGWESWAEAVEM